MDCRPPNAPTFRTEYTPVPLTINLTIHRVWIRGSPLDHALYFRILPRLLKAEGSTVKAPRTNSTLTDLENLVREYIFSHDSDDDKDRFHLLLMRPGQVHKKNERLIGRFEPWLEAKLQSGQEQRWRHASEEVQRARVVRADYMNAKRAWKIVSIPLRTLSFGVFVGSGIVLMACCRIFAGEHGTRS